MALVPILILCVVAVLTDWLSVVWHHARETHRITRMVGISAVLELFTWLPLVYAIEFSSYWAAGASIAGSVIGSTIGGIRYARSTKAVVVNALHQGLERDKTDTGGTLGFDPQRGK